MGNLRIGTCSWKYDSWKGLIYPEFGEFDYLLEYCKNYNTVEIDQWFWSLHPNNKITLPKKEVVKEYSQKTPEDFLFTIKAPNSITLTHPYKSKEPNNNFLSIDLMEAFLNSIDYMSEKVGMIMFQFEYLNRQKMPNQAIFQSKLEEFITKLDRNYCYGIELRNPNYLNENWFLFLKNHDISPVFLQGYFMPNIYDIYKTYESFINNNAVIRLHGFDRKGIEERTKKIWNQIVDPQNKDLKPIIEMINFLNEKEVGLYLNVNNHYEGSAPLTIEKIKKMM